MLPGCISAHPLEHADVKFACGNRGLYLIGDRGLGEERRAQGTAGNDIGSIPGSVLALCRYVERKGC